MPGVLVDSPARVIRQLLIDLGLATNGGATWPAYVDSEPDVPDDCITVYDTEGVDHGREMITAVRQEHSGFQIRVRAPDHQSGWTKANAIATTLDQSVSLRNVVVAGRNYFMQTIVRTSNVLRLGLDSPITNRHLFTINAIAPIEPD